MKKELWTEEKLFKSVENKRKVQNSILNLALDAIQRSNTPVWSPRIAIITSVRNVEVDGKNVCEMEYVDGNGNSSKRHITNSSNS